MARLPLGSSLRPSTARTSSGRTSAPSRASLACTSRRPWPSGHPRSVGAWADGARRRPRP
eukprot:10139001-Alexandrium_andersonii.AAC.1